MTPGGAEMETRDVSPAAGTVAVVEHATIVSDELARILESETFLRSPRLRKFLRLVVEQAVLGKAEEIKEMTLAVMVFGRRPSSFDAQTDPIVRVEARRLRDKLDRYYAAEGADSRIRIVIPKGRYRPVFQTFAGTSAGRRRIYSQTNSFNDWSPDATLAHILASRTTIGTRNSLAADCYDHGCYAAQQGDIVAYSKAIQLFQRAIDADAGFAEAHAALAATLLRFTRCALLPSAGLAQESKMAARQAILIDPALGEAHSVLAALEHHVDRNWPAAETSHARALTLSPASPDCHSMFGLSLAARGRLDEAIGHLLRARDLDPLNIGLRIELAQALCYDRCHEEAIDMLTALLEIAPRHALAEMTLGFAQLQADRPAEARLAFLRARALLPRHASPRLCASAAWAREGREREARAQLAADLEQLNGKYCSHYHLAIVHACLGDHDQVYAHLVQAAEENDLLLTGLPVDPAFDAYHGQARFHATLESCGLAAVEAHAHRGAENALRH